MSLLDTRMFAAKIEFALWGLSLKSQTDIVLFFGEGSLGRGELLTYRFIFPFYFPKQAPLSKISKKYR